MATLQKGLIQRQDSDNYDGTLATSRTSSTGGTTSGLKVGDAIDVLSVYGGGDTGNMTRATIATATAALGAGNHALSFAPGTWTIDDDLTIAANFTCVVPAGCVFSVASGKTLTIAGVLFRQHATYTGGAGTVTATGTDLLAATGVQLDFDDDTGVADAYVITPASAPTAYTEGQTFRFKAGNANTGAATINVNGVGVKSIVKRDGSTALVANDILAARIYTIVYEDTGDHFHLMDGEGLHEDTTPQLAGDLDTNSFDIQFDDAKGIRDDSDNEQLIFQKTASAVNHVEVTNAATGNAPLIAAAGDDTNVPVNIQGKGSGQVQLGDANLKFPDVDGTAGQIPETDGAGAISWRTPPGLEFIESQTASASATIDFTTLGSTYNKFVIDFDGVVAASDTTSLWVLAGTGGTPTWEADAGDYAHTKAMSRGNTEVSFSGDTSDTEIELNLANATWGAGDQANEDISGTLVVYNPHNASAPTHFSWDMVHIAALPAIVKITGGAIFQADTAVTGIRFQFSSGNITAGTFKLYGIRGS